MKKGSVISVAVSLITLLGAGSAAPAWLVGLKYQSDLPSEENLGREPPFEVI